MTSSRHGVSLNAEDGPTDTPCFHAQQTAEKTLKAILTAAGSTI